MDALFPTASFMTTEDQREKEKELPMHLEPELSSGPIMCVKEVLEERLDLLEYKYGFPELLLEKETQQLLSKISLSEEASFFAPEKLQLLISDVQSGYGHQRILSSSWTTEQLCLIQREVLRQYEKQSAKLKMCFYLYNQVVLYQRRHPIQFILAHPPNIHLWLPFVCKDLSDIVISYLPLINSFEELVHLTAHTDYHSDHLNSTLDSVLKKGAEITAGELLSLSGMLDYEWPLLKQKIICKLTIEFNRFSLLVLFHRDVQGLQDGEVLDKWSTFSPIGQYASLWLCSGKKEHTTMTELRDEKKEERKREKREIQKRHQIDEEEEDESKEKQPEIKHRIHLDRVASPSNSDAMPVLAIEFNDHATGWLFPDEPSSPLKIIQGLPKKNTPYQDIPAILTTGSLKLAKTLWKKLQKQGSLYRRLDINAGLSLWIITGANPLTSRDVINIVTF